VFITKSAANHLQDILSEFDFRYNARKISDTDRTLLAISQASGKEASTAGPQQSPVLALRTAPARAIRAA